MPSLLTILNKSPVLAEDFLFLWIVWITGALQGCRAPLFYGYPKKILKFTDTQAIINVAYRSYKGIFTIGIKLAKYSLYN